MKTSILSTMILFLAFQVIGQQNLNNVDTQLFLGKGENQPLIVAFGGAEGGNPWAGNRVKNKRDRLIDKGYAFLSVGYFGTANSPKILDRISLEDIHDAIIEVAKHPKINSEKIALIGVSKGAELALLMASHFDDINCVIAMVPGYCVFPGHTQTFTTSSWTYKGEEVPFAPMKEEAIPALIEHDLHTAFSIMISDKEAVEKARIEVENINGSILLLSAKNDEQWPSTEMSNAMIKTLDQNQFPHPYKHIAIEGGHFEVFDHFDKIYTFLDDYFAGDKVH